MLVFRDVSERHAAEAALRESEERSAFVRRSSGVGFWYCDLPFDVLQWDDLVKAHFHLPLDAVVTIELFYDRIHPDDREPTRSAIERSIATRTTYNVDYRTVNPESGAEKWIRAIGRTFYDADGAPTRFDGVTLDVTDQKRSEERQAFLIRLADTLRPLCDPVVVQAEASRVLGEHFRANRVAYFEIRGDEYVVERDYAVGVETLVGRYPVAAFGSVLLTELLNGRTFVEADATTTADRLESEQAAFAALQVRGHVDVPLVKDGRFVAGLTVHHAERREWSREEVALIEETAERTWAAIERVRAEAALRQSEERRRLALDAAEMGAWHIDPATSTLHSDDRFRVIFTGAAEDPITYEQAFAAIHPNDRERIRQAVAAATQPDAPLPYAEEYRVVHADGTVRWVFGKGRANFERGGAGRLVSFDGTVADVTARKRIEEERERLLAQLREAGRRKDEFLATLAHELRNPLAPIRNGLQVLKMTDQREIEEQARSMMERQLDQMVRLVDDLLDVSRITQGKLELRKERVTLEAVLNSAIETSRGLIDQMEHEFTATLPGHSIVLEADLTRLSQVFSNLLNNAAKYSEPGGKISLRAEREGNHVAVSVKDAGIGIAPDQLPRLFEMFSQLDRSLEKSQGGLGIGLSLVKGLVEMHNGVVEARSDGPGRGSEFTVRLPLVAEESNPLHQSSPRAAATLQSALRILIVDDNRDGADSLAAMMQLMGNVTRTAYDGEDAVAAAADFQPDVILLDIGLPKLNGYDAC
ncbi:MAG TPA: ATP-binding protein, partial [Pirellulales bacterium]